MLRCRRRRPPPAPCAGSVFPARPSEPESCPGGTGVKVLQKLHGLGACTLVHHEGAQGKSVLLVQKEQLKPQSPVERKSRDRNEPNPTVGRPLQHPRVIAKVSKGDISGHWVEGCADSPSDCQDRFETLSRFG